MPDRLSPDELRRLLNLAARDSRTKEEVQYAVQTVRGWWETRRQQRLDWPMVVINAMRSGWGMRGFKQWQGRTSGQHEINARTGEPIVKSTPLTPERIEALVERQKGV